MITDKLTAFVLRNAKTKKEMEKFNMKEGLVVPEGKALAVLMPDGKWYECTLKDYNSETGMSTVILNDGPHRVCREAEFAFVPAEGGEA